MRLVMDELSTLFPDRYRFSSYRVGYPADGSQRCDLCLGKAPDWSWALEIKMLRFFGDNGKLNDNILMHLLSPYPAHRSALTDCKKLARSAFQCRKAVIIYGFDYPDWSLDPAIDAFEILARAYAALGQRHEAPFDGLVHPLHTSGRVFAWEVIG